MNRELQTIGKAWNAMIGVLASLNEVAGALEDSLHEFYKALEKLEAALEEAEAEE